jgi:hypothetical protein
MRGVLVYEIQTVRTFRDEVGGTDLADQTQQWNLGWSGDLESLG